MTKYVLTYNGKATEVYAGSLDEAMSKILQKYREEKAALTVAELIAILKTQPQDAKVLIEDFNGSASTYLQAEHVLEAWERDNDEGTAQEHVMMLTTYKEEETS